MCEYNNIYYIIQGGSFITKTVIFSVNLCVLGNIISLRNLKIITTNFLKKKNVYISNTIFIVTNL